jgi:hypothetical protein
VAQALLPAALTLLSAQASEARPFVLVRLVNLQKLVGGDVFQHLQYPAGPGGPSGGTNQVLRKGARKGSQATMNSVW